MSVGVRKQDKLGKRCPELLDKLDVSVLEASTHGGTKIGTLKRCPGPRIPAQLTKFYKNVLKSPHQGALRRPPSPAGSAAPRQLTKHPSVHPPEASATENRTLRLS